MPRCRLPQRSSKSHINSSNTMAGRALILVPTLLLLLAAFILVASQSLAPLVRSQHQNGTLKSSYQQLSELLVAHQPDQDALSSSQLNLELATLSGALLKGYNRANDMRAYSLDLHSYREDAKFAGDPIFVDSQNQEHIETCSKHLSAYYRQLEFFRQLDPINERVPLDTLRLADSFGRPEAGALLGNQFWIGNYEGCLKFKLKQGINQKPIQAQYCLGITQFPSWNSEDSKNSIKIGLCLPETCTTSMINENSAMLNMVETMFKHQIGEQSPFSQLQLKQVYCLPHETSEIRQYTTSAKFFFFVIGIFVTSCLVATSLDYFNSRMEKSSKPQKRNRKIILVESFSIIKNWEKFMYIREDTPDHSENSTGLVDETFNRDVLLNSTAGLKCLGLFWIICGHTFLVSPITSRNILHADELTDTYLADIYLTAHLMVDTFFTLSGLLASYFLFREGLDKIGKKEWVVLTLHRYWRLTPIYLLSYWFTKSVGYLVNGGPLWDYMTAEQSPRLNCNRESWFDAIFHLSDFKSPKEHCVPFAWFIANGIKFWILTPLFLILIHKSMRRGYITAICAIIINIALVTTLAMKSNVDMKSVIEFKPESADNMLNNMGEVYTRPYSRIGTYLIGLLAGHLMYLLDTKKLEFKLSNQVNILLWTLFSVITLGLTFVLKIAKQLPLDEQAIPIVFGLCSALIRPLWALCTCWLVFALSHGQAKWLARFLTANCWRLLVKLSFCAYLLQAEVLAQLELAVNFSGVFSYKDMISRPLVITVITLVGSFVLVLIIESPLIGIEELVLPKRHKKASQSITASGDNQSQAETQKLKAH